MLHHGICYQAQTNRETDSITAAHLFPAHPNIYLIKTKHRSWGSKGQDQYNRLLSLMPLSVFCPALMNTEETMRLARSTVTVTQDGLVGRCTVLARQMSMVQVSLTILLSLMSKVFLHFSKVTKQHFVLSVHKW